MSYYTHPFRLYVLIISEDFRPSPPRLNRTTEINADITLPHPSTIRSLSDLGAQIRASLLAKPNIYNNPRGTERVRTMRVVEMSVGMAKTAKRDGPVDTMVLREGNLGRGLRELYARDWEWDYTEVRVDPETRVPRLRVRGESPRPEPTRRPSTPRSRPPSPMFGNDREAVESRAEARRSRLEREDKEDLAEVRRLRAQRERLRERF